MLKPKHHSLTVRLSQQEYDLLVQQCVASGARSISDHARATLFNRTEGPELCVRLTAVECGMRSLAQELCVVREQLELLRDSATSSVDQ